MPVIDEFMPSYRMREVEHMAVRAEPREAWATLRDVDLQRVPWIRWLFGLRVLPARLWGQLTGRPAPRNPGGRLDDFTGPGMGFVRLAEAPGREVVVGSVGRFWNPRLPFVATTPEAFRRPLGPGLGRLAYNLRVDPREGGGSWLTVDLRVTTADDASWRRFRRYWRLIGPFSRAIRRSLLRLAARELGQAPREASRPLPADELLPHARYQRTLSRTVEAQPARVWPWLLQLGADRAGWYSIDRLDNAGRRSADRLIPGLQHLEVGQIIPALPGSAVGFAVLRIDPGRLLVLGSPSLLPNIDRAEDAPPMEDTWAFHLEPIGDFATHLVTRVRASYARCPRLRLRARAIDLAHVVMQRSQLRHLAQRIERQGLAPA